MQAIASQTRLKLVVDSFDMSVKNEECLLCHLIIIGYCEQCRDEKMVRTFWDCDGGRAALGSTIGLASNSAVLQHSSLPHAKD